MLNDQNLLTTAAAPSEPPSCSRVAGLSPLASVAATLVANGYSPLPVRPDGKAPGTFARGEWFLMRDWSRYCERQPTEFEVKHWSSFPDSNVGVACGRGVLAFDIDRDELVADILAVLPPVVVAKKGRKGLTAFYRGDTKTIRSRGFKIETLGVMDLISDGKQTVIPPSIHPDTGEPYAWTTPRTLLDTRPEELPEVTQAHVDAVIEVLKRYGYDPASQSRPQLEAGAPIEIADHDGGEAREFFRKLNDDALANLHAWVPRIGLQKIQRQGDHYRAVAEWRPSNSGKPLFKRILHVSIHPKGIVDYGDGEKTYTPIDLVMTAFDLSQYQVDKAVTWLGGHLGYNFAPTIVLNRARNPAEPAAEQAPADEEPESDGTGMSEAEFEEMTRLMASASAPPPAVVEPPPLACAEPFDPATGEVFPAAAPIAAVDYAGMTPETEMEALTHVPGLVGDLVDWFCATSRTPNRTLAFAAALVFVGTLAGRIYKSPSGLRTNLYALSLAPSGFGKDAARKCIDSLATEGGLGEWIAGDGIASGSGMRRRVEQHPAIMWKIDEFGGFMKKIGDPRASHHTKQIRDNLLTYYGSAGSVFRGEDYAGERGSVCHHPNVGIYGTSTPVDFWGACQSLSVGDGLLARFVIFTVGDAKRPKARPAAASYEEPPADLIQRCKAVARPKCGGNLAHLMEGSRPSRPLAVPYGRGAEAAFESMAEAFADRADAADREEEPFWHRAVENATKIALVLAIGEDPDRPVITVENLRIGRRLVELCIDSTLLEIKGRLADNDRQREHIYLRRLIEEAGAEGVSRTQLCLKINGKFPAARRDDILRTLEEDEKAIVTLLGDNARGPKGARFVARRFLGEERAK